MRDSESKTTPYCLALAAVSLETVDHHPAAFRGAQALDYRWRRVSGPVVDEDEREIRPAY